MIGAVPGLRLRWTLGLAINQPPPCLTGFLPASEWRSPADTSLAPLPSGTYCKIPQDYQGNVVRGARNYPCVDVPGKRAATPRECRSNKPYVPLGTNPWYGDPNQILTCPAPAARCDQPVKPGKVIPAPTVNNGMNPAPADQVPRARRRRSAIRCTARVGHRPVQRAAAQPVRLHSRARRPRRSTARRAARWSDPTASSTPSEFEQHRRRRMEGDAGASRLNPTGLAR